jgi:ATP-dependent HslUV protease ATP-binding subunit HslU
LKLIAASELSDFEESLTPRRIVEELDKYIISQDAAKKAVAIALRNRFRRRKLPDAMRKEVIPKNIIMIGPTGVGKTEIARRLANLTGSPMVKVEATKYTEVGYVGRDVESMIRDLTQKGIDIVRAEKMEEVREKAEKAAEERLLDLLQPLPSSAKGIDTALKQFHQYRPRDARAGDERPVDPSAPEQPQTEEDRFAQLKRIRERYRKQLKKGELETTIVELDVEEGRPKIIEMFSSQGMEGMGVGLHEMMGDMIPKRRQRRKMPIREAREAIIKEEMNKLIDMDQVQHEAIDKVQETGIVFIDEIDKIVGSEKAHGPDVSREGVQRDILPLIEGSTVQTKYGPVDTNHILFIAAGAFHAHKPSELIPELQGRFPIRVELKGLNADDFVRILTEPENALVKQYQALLSTENVELEFTTDGIRELADFAAEVNASTENIGARRLHTILEKVLEETSFNAPDEVKGKVIVNSEFVRKQVADLVEDRDLSKYIL